MKVSDYVRYHGLGLADQIRRREVSREEVVAAAMEVARLQNPEINAICYEAYEQALDEARAKDANRASGGPFDGVPLLLNHFRFERKGSPQRLGSCAFEKQVARYTTNLTQRYLDAGVVPIRKSAIPEFGMIPVCRGKQTISRSATGLTSCTLDRFIFPSPRAMIVSFWFFGRSIKLLTCVTLIFAMSNYYYPFTSVLSFTGIPKTVSMLTFLCFATCCGLRNKVSALMVALTTLCGFDDPIDFASTL